MATTLTQTAGEIQRAIYSIREYMDEPSLQAKYTDTRLLQKLNESWQEVLYDLYAQAVNPPLACYAVTLTTSQQYYLLPASVGEIRRIVRLDSSGNVIWEVIPDAWLSPSGPGIVFEGTQRFWLSTGHIQEGDQIEIQYIPSGNVILHKGQSEVDITLADTEFLLGDPGDSLLGAVDRRPNAYLGCYLGLLDYGGPPPAGHNFFPLQQRIITDYNVATGKLTVLPAFDFEWADLPTATPAPYISYEIYPIEAPIIWTVLARHVARVIAGVEGKKERFKTLTTLMAEAKRACALVWANAETRSGRNMPSATVDNRDFMRGIL